MTAILKKDYSVFNAQTFIDMFGRVWPQPAQNAQNYLYLAIGKTTEWATPASPDTPTNVIDKEKEMRDNVLFMKKVAIDDISLVIPRKDYANRIDATVFPGDNKQVPSAIDTTSLTPYASRDYYFMTSTGLVFEYTDASSTYITEITEPADSTDIATSEGRTIDYQYTINLGSRFLTDDWMPVSYNLHGHFNPYNGSDPNWDSENGTLSRDQIEDGNVFANQRLSANHVMIVSTLGEEFLEVIDSDPTEYRQIALIANPRNRDGDLMTGDFYGHTNPATAPNIIINDGSGDEIVGDDGGLGIQGSDADAYTGQMVYLENRVRITRVVGQAETTKFVIEF